MRKFLFALAILFALNFSVASAEIETVEGTDEYTIDKMLKEDINTATEHAREDARRRAAEKAGVAVRSYSRMKNFELEEDIVETIAGAILEIFDDEVTFEPIDNGHSVKIICRIKARVDTSKVEKFLGDRNWLKEREAKDKRILELEAELKKAKAEKNQSEFDLKQNQFLIAKYERDLDIYDFDKKINLQDMMATAEKLAAVDAGNAAAFRATVYVYRHEDKIQNVVDYCKQMLEANTSAEISIEACAQLGDIYYNEILDAPTAKKYVDMGIALVKKKYSKAEIEKLVNGTNVEIKDMRIVGRSNTIRELYILKSNIENVNPKFDMITEIEEMILIQDRIYNIKYRTDW